MAKFVGKYMALRDMFIYPGTHLYNIYITFGPKLLTIWVIYAMWGKVEHYGELWGKREYMYIYLSIYQ
jgi:hypothetical protein